MEIKNKSLFKQQCFIGGKWVKSLSGETIEVDNPASQKIKALFLNVGPKKPNKQLIRQIQLLKIGSLKLQKKGQLY